MADAPTLFERILSGELPGDILHKDEHCFVLRDINPQAPTHLLVIPRKPIPRVGEAAEGDQALLGYLLLVAAQMARTHNLASGYRVVLNNGLDGGEAVPHLHLHLLGGRALTWPPG